MKEFHICGDCGWRTEPVHKDPSLPGPAPGSATNLVGSFYSVWSAGITARRAERIETKSRQPLGR